MLAGPFIMVPPPPAPLSELIFCYTRQDPEFKKGGKTFPTHSAIVDVVHRGGSMRVCHAAGPGSILGRDKFPG